MYFIAKTTTWLSGVVCLTVLGLSIYPGWLQDLLYWSIILGLFASPILVGILAFFLFTQYRRGIFRTSRVPKFYAIVTLVRSSSKCSVIGASVAILARRSKQANLHDSSMQTNAARSRRNPPGRYKFAMTALSMLLTTYTILKLYLPRRFAFAACRGSFQQIVDEGVEDEFEFNQSIGPYKINDCFVDERGGTFFRVHSGGDGIGPDIMSYGFCYKPNRHGTPFGASGYRTYPLGEGWYWFQASDDFF